MGSAPFCFSKSKQIICLLAGLDRNKIFGYTSIALAYFTLTTTNSGLPYFEVSCILF
jgi:hypothetical protein